MNRLILGIVGSAAVATDASNTDPYAQKPTASNNWNSVRTPDDAGPVD